MVANPCELIGLCLGIIGLIGASAVTGLPMWRVTAFIQENIIVMETRWEGLWMNCFRQANIRMQCKVYDSLLYLPPDLQAARGLMCCSVALSLVGLIASIPGLHSTSCLKEQPRLKSLIITIVGLMEIMAALCVLIPVSWTAHSIIQDFYNPLLLDAQRRELGEALYIGWVTAFLLFSSGVVFLSCRNHQSNELYRPVNAFQGSAMSYLLPTASSQHPLLISPNPSLQHLSPMTYSPVAMTPGGSPAQYSVPVVYPANMKPVQHYLFERLSPPRNSFHSTINSTLTSIQSAPLTMGHNRSLSSPLHSNLSPPVMLGYAGASNKPQSTQSTSGIYI